MKKVLFIAFLFAVLLAACGSLEGDALSFKTADPRLSIGVRLLPPPAPEPCELVIKGNINAQQEKIAHSPGQANYENTVITPANGEKWFCTLEQAIAEGWRAAQR